MLVVMMKNYINIIMLCPGARFYVSVVYYARSHLVPALYNHRSVQSIHEVMVPFHRKIYFRSYKIKISVVLCM